MLALHMFTHSALIMLVLHQVTPRVTTPIWRRVDCLRIALTDVPRRVQATESTIEVWKWCWLHYFAHLLLEFFDHGIVVVVVDTVHACSVLMEWSQLAYEVKVS